MERQLQGILFDLDETLYSREEAFWTWLEIEARSAAKPTQLDRQKIAALDQRGRGDKQALLDYLDSFFGWRQTQPERLQRFRDGMQAAVQLAPGAREMLTRLAGQYRLGLVSNGTGPTQRMKLKALAVEDLFDPVVISEEVGLRKPDVRIFELAIANWQVPPGAVLFVGDDPVADIGGASAAGLQTLQVGHENGIQVLTTLEAWLRQRRG